VPRAPLLPVGVAVAVLLGLGGCHGRRSVVTPAAQLPSSGTAPSCAEGTPRLNEEELFAAGTAAFGEEAFDSAARCFGQLAEFFPESRYRVEALYKAGESHQRLKEWEAALKRFGAVADPEAPEGLHLEGAFRQAETLYHLGRFDDARRLLDRVVTRSDLPLQRKLEAQVQRGVCELEAGDSEAAEHSLREALDAYGPLRKRESVDDYYPAQAQFFLGELYRLHCQEVHLDAGESATALGKELEYKAELLLSAQGHYLRAIRMSHPYWATAAGAQIGLLYESLYDEMIHAPPPRELDPREMELYRQELRKKVRVLVGKAITAYEQTLEAAERVGSAGPFIERTRESLQRMKALMITEADS
jgi:tetratricopeptide (TPR) repeat protein